jgi:hypothetical protein
MGACIGKKKVAPAGDHQEPARTSEAALKQPDASKLPRLKPQYSERLSKQGAPTATVALAQARGGGPPPLPPVPGALDATSRHKSAASTAKAPGGQKAASKSQAQPGRGKGASKARPIQLQDPETRYASAAWTATLSAKQPRSTSLSRNLPGSIPGGSSAYASTSTRAPALQSHLGRGSHSDLRPHASLPDAPSRSSRAQKSLPGDRDHDAQVVGLIGAMLCGPVPDDVPSLSDSTAMRPWR